VREIQKARELLNFNPVLNMQELLSEQIDIANESDFTSEFIMLLYREKDGGSCPHCQNSWQKISVDNIYATFHYFDPVCSCYSKCRICKGSLHREIAMNFEGCTSCGTKKNKIVSVDEKVKQINKYKSGFKKLNTGGTP